jgi:mitotic-spindle organizing protein 1
MSWQKKEAYKKSTLVNVALLTNQKVSAGAHFRIEPACIIIALSTLQLLTRGRGFNQICFRHSTNSVTNSGPEKGLIILGGSSILQIMAASNNTKREGGNRKEEQKNSQSSGSQLTEARETFATLFELSKLLNTGLDQDSLAICVRLCEGGAHPEALATIVRELRRESQAIRR